MKIIYGLLVALLSLPLNLFAQTDSTKRAISAGYGFRFANQRIGMHLSLGYIFEYPIGKKGFSGGAKAFASYGAVPEKTETTSLSPQGFQRYSRQEGQFYIINLGLVKSFGYKHHFLNLGLDAQLWQFGGIFFEEYDNKRWRYSRERVDRYLGAVLGYSYRRLEGLGFSLLWNPQLDYLDSPRTELQTTNFIAEVHYSF